MRRRFAPLFPPCATSEAVVVLARAGLASTIHLGQPAPSQQMQLQMEQQQHGFRIHELAAIDHCQRLFVRQLMYFDILAFDILAYASHAAAIADLIVGRVLPNKKVQPFGHGPRAHEQLVDLAHGADAAAGFFFDLVADTLLRSGVVEQAGRHFDQEARMPVDVRGDRNWRVISTVR